MNIKINKRMDSTLKLHSIDIRASSTIYDDAKIQNTIWLQEGNFQLCITLERSDTESLITLLNKHLNNINENEIEVACSPQPASEERDGK